MLPDPEFRDTVPVPLLLTAAAPGTPGTPPRIVMPFASTVSEVPTPPPTSRPPVPTTTNPVASMSTFTPDTVPITCTEEALPPPAEM